jgi:hypothetical protein
MQSDGVPGDDDNGLTLWSVVVAVERKEFIHYIKYHKTLSQ